MATKGGEKYGWRAIISEGRLRSQREGGGIRKSWQVEQATSTNEYKCKCGG